MARTEGNPFDAVRESLVQAMMAVSGDIKERAGRSKPYDATELKPHEEDLLWDHPAARYPNEIDPTSGLPLSNAQAANKWYQEVTNNDQYPSRWVEMVDDYDRRKARRTPTAPTTEEAPDGQYPNP